MDNFQQFFFRSRPPVILKKIKSIHIILILGLINGLIFVFLIPPWQHYDEPGHFEYAWLIANRLRLPQPGDYDQNMRLALGKSLIDSSFFRGGNLPNLTDPSQPIWIGIPQLSDPPLYSIIEAGPLYFFRGAPIDLQLHIGRITSLLFLLITIYCSYKLVSELTTGGHPLQWMVPLFIALMPGFVEFMSAVNDLVAAIGLFSVWLLIATRLIIKFSYKNTLFLLGLTLAGLYTQVVLYPVVLYLPIVIVLSIIPQKFKYLGWLASFCLVITCLIGAFRWGDAAYWLRNSYQDYPTRVQVNNVDGVTYAIQGSIVPDTNWGQGDPPWDPGFFQLIPTNISRTLNGKTVTLGAWVWSDTNIRSYGPGLNSLFGLTDQWSGFKQINLDKNPRFIASAIRLPNDLDRLQIWLRTTSPDSQNEKVYFSGVVLAEGEMPITVAPQFTDKEGTKGIWGDKVFTNLVRNAQFTQAWPYMRSQFFNLVAQKITGLNPTHISSVFSLFLDFPGTGWYWRSASATIFRAFWAKFSWGQVPLVPLKFMLNPYRLLLIFTLVGMVSCVIFGFRILKDKKYEFGFLLAVMTMTFLVTFFYGVYTMGGALRFRAYLPTARYIFPALIPISIFLALGWQGLLSWITGLLKLAPKYGYFLYAGFLIVLDIYAYFSILTYFSY